jgi:hypothetical protein
MFRKFLYEMMDMQKECIGEMHYEIRFPECISSDDQMCRDLMEEFEDQVKALAWKMGIKLEEI